MGCLPSVYPSDQYRCIVDSGGIFFILDTLQSVDGHQGCRQKEFAIDFALSCDSRASNFLPAALCSHWGLCGVCRIAWRQSVARFRTSAQVHCFGRRSPALAYNVPSSFAGYDSIFSEVSKDARTAASAHSAGRVNKKRAGVSPAIEEDVDGRVFALRACPAMKTERVEPQSERLLSFTLSASI